MTSTLQQSADRPAHRGGTHFVASESFPAQGSFRNVSRDRQDAFHRSSRVSYRMTEIASSRQLLAGLLRWVVVLVPAMLLLGFVSASASGSGPDNPWFAALAKPALYPSPSTFPIVWSVAYVLMGVALSMIASARGSTGRGLAIGIFALHLLANFAWSVIFFGQHNIGLALGDVVVMDITLAASIFLFARLRPVAAWLLAPVMAWVLFATLLNWQVLSLNPDAHEGAQAAGSVHVTF
jgi:tryptophan-rich sensory protein